MDVLDIPDSDEIHVGFTGTRHGMTTDQERRVWWVLNDLKERCPVIIGHHGDCLGADVQFDRMCLASGARVVVHPPTQDGVRARLPATDERSVLGAKSYMNRNRDIVRASDGLLATPCAPQRGPSRGTWATVRMASLAGLAVFVYEFDGTLYVPRS